ncbi:TetR family transcriptional regulator [Nocardia transvalensis]|uniref:TetR family transcriptional regulator n=1 Tax=Nocardia transvalensis TaxID=37333 RepID=UPI001894DDB6|nr:TetR family transcriptional regulator [Nocardia transvalensis]MBF6332302.1 TetR family transcriptional regulator [Nocardia transvalensis]
MTEATGWQAQEKARVRQELIMAALRLFEEQGFDRASIQQIAEAAGVTRRTFSRHFPSKAAVLFAHEEQLFARLRAALQRRSVDESALTASRAAVRELLLGPRPQALTSTEIDSVRRARLLLITNPTLWQENYFGAIQRQHDLAHVFAQRADLPDTDLAPRIVGAACFAVVGTALDHWVLHGDHSVTALHQILDAALASLQHGIDIQPQA